jgi:hypothetical protein
MRALFALIIFASAFLATPLAAQYQQPLDNAVYADSQENVFLRDEITYVTVTMAPADLQFLLDNRQTDIYKDCSVHIVNSQIDEIYDNVGIRPRGNSGRSAKKNPWKFSFHEFVPGRRLHGLKKMNLGGDAPDPTLSRSSTMFDSFRAMGVPASRTHHVWLKINDGLDVEGLFVHLEQVDEIFVNAWFGNNDGALYKCRIRSQPANLTFQAPGFPATYAAIDAYEEKILGGDYLLLAQFINFINNTAGSQFANEIGDWINVDGFLRAQASDVIAGQWDGMWIGGNNYYLYQNTETGLIEYIPWDLDHSYGMDYLFFPILGNFGTDFATKPYLNWGNRGFGMTGNEPPPLIERLLDINHYDDVLKGYCREGAAGAFHPNSSFPRIDQLKTMLAPLAFTGSFHNASMDNGYDNADFLAGYDFPAQYSAFTTPATWGLKAYITARREFIASNYPIPAAGPRVFVNEVCADNSSTIADEAGEFDDWVELYNDEDVAVDLSGWFMGDRPGAAREWQFPAGTVIPAKGHLLVWCDNDLLQGPLHTNFKLTSNGEGVHLWMPELFGHVQADSLLFPALSNDESFGRFPDGTPIVEHFVTPTPAQTNEQGGLALRLSGNCPGEISLHVGGATPGGTVAFIAAAGPGSFAIPNGFPCAGLMVSLDANTAMVAGQVNADGNGYASLTTDTPANFCGTIMMQALDISSCTITSVVGL